MPVRIIGVAKGQSLASLETSLNFEKSNELRDRGIWQSVFGRTSSRPVDMVFSIMGLFGIALDPGAFDENDRIGATIALAQAILRNGGCASWIGLASRARPCPQLSTFPEFPQTRVAGKAMLFALSDEPVEAYKLLDTDSWWEVEYGSKKGSSSAEREKQREALRLRGDMDDDGYLTFMRKAFAVTPIATAKAPAKAARYAQTVQGELWEFLDDVDIDKQEYPRTAAVLLGTYHPPSIGDSESGSVTESDSESDSDSNTGLPLDWDPSAIFKFMLIKEHVLKKFHLVSYFAIREGGEFGQRD